MSSPMLQVDSPPARPAPQPPLVRAVVVSTGSEHLRRCLSAVKAQSYRYMEVLVAATSGTADPRPLVAEILPFAEVRNVEARGVGEAANLALGDPKPPVFYWFLHDDAAPKPEALAALVEGARSQQAGVVGGKLVRWGAPEHLLDVGGIVDRFGYPHGGTEEGELDQAQYDVVREVFFVAGASLLVAAGLFKALGGFDPAFRAQVEDMDLCWRARI